MPALCNIQIEFVLNLVVKMLALKLEKSTSCHITKEFQIFHINMSLKVNVVFIYTAIKQS